MSVISSSSSSRNSLAIGTSIRTSGARRSRSVVGALLAGGSPLLAGAAVVGEDALDRVGDLLEVVAVDDDLGRGVGREHELVDGDVREGEAVADEELAVATPSHAVDLSLQVVAVVERLL